MSTESQSAQHLTFGWVTTWRTSHALVDMIRKWLDDQFAHEVIVEHHDAMTAQAMEEWCRINTNGEIVIAILSGDGGELMAKFQKAEDAASFTRRWVGEPSRIAGDPTSGLDASAADSVDH